MISVCKPNPLIIENILIRSPPQQAHLFLVVVVVSSQLHSIHIQQTFFVKNSFCLNSILYWRVANFYALIVFASFNHKIKLKYEMYTMHFNVFFCEQEAF